MTEVMSRADDLRCAESGISAADFNSLVQNSPDGIVVMDLDGTILYANRASEVMFDHDQDFLLGQPLGYPAMSGGTTEIEILQHEKPPLVAEMRVVNVDWNGESSLLATMRDISERIKLTKELVRSNSDLEKFASVVSHEIRAPLRNLHLLSGWLLEDHSSDLNSDAIEDVELMRKTTGRMQRMVEDLLHYSRVDSQQKVSADVNLKDVLVDALDNLQEEIFRSDAQFVEDALPTIDCNVAQMVTMFQHILSNAITFSTEPPRITITSSRDGDMWKISFSDNGIGVDKEYWEKIFIPFNHLRNNDAYDGTGIGLATCKKIAELHRGTIWLESVPGVGSVVHVCLPEKRQEIVKVPDDLE